MPITIKVKSSKVTLDLNAVFIDFHVSAVRTDHM